MRNYQGLASRPHEIVKLSEKWKGYQDDARSLRERNNRIQAQLKRGVQKLSGNMQDALEGGDKENLQGLGKDGLLAEAKRLKGAIGGIEIKEKEVVNEIDVLAASLPNLTSIQTPQGDEIKVVGYINQHPAKQNPSRKWRSHIDIGRDLSLLDFTSSATTSGWGWYYLLNEAALLEQALIQYALSVARKRGWQMVTPPSIVYSHIAHACGFQPRDQNGESQIYTLQQTPEDSGRKPELCLAGTAEIPLAGMKANTIMEEAEFPMKRIGVSRCYRAEAGARGADTKGLYRVHEFTKVEMFAWTLPSTPLSEEIFNEMLSIQTEILTSLGLHCRILEMPSTDLGASATRKRDIEAWFPSRTEIDDGWGEVTSVSTCTDYQTRRLATRVKRKSGGGKLEFPYTVNGTALAVPRVLAAIIENGWDQERGVVKVPACLRGWMDGIEEIGGGYDGVALT